jgi:hypothetical protein
VLEEDWRNLASPLWGIGFFPCMPVPTTQVPVHKENITQKEKECQKMALLRILHMFSKKTEEEK